MFNGLARTPKHGYAILLDVAQLSDGRLQLSTGTLYGALRRLLDQGWIERYDEASEVVSGRERKAYPPHPARRRTGGPPATNPDVSIEREKWE